MSFHRYDNCAGIGFTAHSRTTKTTRKVLFGVYVLHFWLPRNQNSRNPINETSYSSISNDVEKPKWQRKMLPVLFRQAQHVHILRCPYKTHTSYSTHLNTDLCLLEKKTRSMKSKCGDVNRSRWARIAKLNSRYNSRFLLYLSQLDSNR
jgi:hypothetical protein